MLKKTVYVLQDTNDYALELGRALSDTNEFDVVGTSSNGVSALEEIANVKPQFIITELILSGYDGLSVVKKVRERDSDVKIIVVSAICRDEIVKKATSLGANYFLAKPCSAQIIKERLLQMSEDEMRVDYAKTEKKQRLEEKISNIFINVGIPPHIKGYSFLREGVKMAVETPDIINNITKKLYPKIGEKFETTPSKVERAIRHAIEVAWNRGRIESINSILGVRAYVGQEKPTNGEFIALVADKMLLEKDVDEVGK